MIFFVPKHTSNVYTESDTKQKKIRIMLSQSSNREIKQSEKREKRQRERNEKKKHTTLTKGKNMVESLERTNEQQSFVCLRL